MLSKTKISKALIVAFLLPISLFTVNPSAQGVQPLPSLGTAENYVFLAGNAFSIEPALSISGVPGAFIGEFPGITLNQAAVTFLNANAAIAQIGNQAAGTAAADTQRAFDQFSALTTTIHSGEVGAGTGGVNVIYPGIYEPGNTTTNLANNAAITASTDIILDAQGDANAKFVFITRGAMITTAGISVVLRNGANASNIYWIIGADFTTGAGTIFRGTVIASAAATLGAATILSGRVLCLSTCPITVGDGTVMNALASESETARLLAIAAQVEADRLAALAAQVEIARLAALAAQTEANRLVALAAQIESDRLAALAAQVEAARLATLATQVEVARLAALAAQVEAARLIAVAAQAEANRLAALAIKGEVDRLAALAAQAEANRLAALAAKAEVDRLATLAAKAEADRLAALNVIPPVVNPPKADPAVNPPVVITVPVVKPESFIKPVGSVYFATGSSKLTTESKKVLAQLTSKLAQAKVTNIAVFGYTDSQGVNYDNKALSIRRANAVATYIRSKGISTLLRSTGKGILVTKSASKNVATSRRVDVLTK